VKLFLDIGTESIMIFQEVSTSSAHLSLLSGQDIRVTSIQNSQRAGSEELTASGS
jgi:hypothetical protein